MDGKKEKIVYFDMKGRAEPLRLLFVLSETAFEDERINREEFMKRKAGGEFPYGQVPVASVNGQMSGQSNSILRYHGKRLGFYPEDALLAYHVDEMMDAVNDVRAKIIPCVFAPDDQKRTELRAALVETVLPQQLGFLDKALQRNGAHAFCVSDKPTIADLDLLQLLDMILSPMIDFVPNTILDGFEHLQRVFKNVNELPKLVEHYAK